jgi:hypothetical protein
MSFLQKLHWVLPVVIAVSSYVTVYYIGKLVAYDEVCEMMDACS